MSLTFGPPGSGDPSFSFASQPWAWIVIPAGIVLAIGAAAAVLHTARRRRIRRQRAAAGPQSDAWEMAERGGQRPATASQWNPWSWMNGGTPAVAGRRTVDEGLNELGEAPPPYSGAAKKNLAVPGTGPGAGDGLLQAMPPAMVREQDGEVGAGDSDEAGSGRGLHGSAVPPPPGYGTEWEEGGREESTRLFALGQNSHEPVVGSSGSSLVGATNPNDSTTTTAYHSDDQESATYITDTTTTTTATAHGGSQSRLGTPERALLHDDMRRPQDPSSA